MRRPNKSLIAIVAVSSLLLATQAFASGPDELKAVRAFETEDLGTVDVLEKLYGIPINLEAYRLTKQGNRQNSAVSSAEKTPFKIEKGDSLRQTLDRLREAKHGLWDWSVVNEQVCIFRRPYPEVIQSPDSEDVMVQTIDCTIERESVWEALKKVGNAVNTSPQAVRPLVVQPADTSMAKGAPPPDSFMAEGTITLDVKGESVRNVVTKIFQLSNLPISYRYYPGPTDATEISNTLVISFRSNPQRSTRMSLEEEQYWTAEMKEFGETFEASHPEQR